MSSLYEIDQEILGCIDPETGEIADFEAFDALQMERNKKIENIALWIKNLKAEAEGYKTEKQAFADRQKACENKAESLKNYLEYVLSGTPFKTTLVAVSFRKTTKVEVDDIQAVPVEYLRYKEPEVDKEAVKKALKDSTEEISGVHLVNGLSMSIK